MNWDNREGASQQSCLSTSEEGLIIDVYRDGYGIAPIVKILEGPKEAAVTSAAADLVRAVALNNDANKNAVREAWALPQLVKLLGSEVSTNASDL